MQDPTPHDIQREVEALRSIKRRSVIQGPGALPLDPDLPESPESLSGFWDGQSRDPQSSQPTSTISAAEKDTDVPADNSGHLFWVPAHLHPELAPQEFRAFLKEHARSSPEIVNGVTRAKSSSSTGSINRRKSFLSRQYKPSPNDGVENEDDAAALNRRNRGGFANVSPHLDLQRLEELAEEAAESDDPSKLRHLLRRSLSMNVAPSGPFQSYFW